MTEYAAMRSEHIKQTQAVSGLVCAWSDFFAYLGEAMQRPHPECPYCGKTVWDSDDFYDCGTEEHRWREHVECSDDAEAAK